jgi:hypothetical protein
LPPFASPSLRLREFMIVGDKLYDTVDAEGKTKNGKRF